MLNNHIETAMQTLNRLAWLLFVALVGATASNAHAQIKVTLTEGWNLIGNGYYASLDVANHPQLTDVENVVTVWKWLPVPGKWAFYAPAKTPGDLAIYAGEKGYAVLNVINSGEGFWVNAKKTFELELHKATPTRIPSVAFQVGSLSLSPSWNLIATGDTPTPRIFTNAIAKQAPTSGVDTQVLITMWAWDAASSTWHFYAPGLDNEGKLAAYIAEKGYKNFEATQENQPTTTQSIGTTSGFWVNRK